jgi:tripartite-type tricarboxylate transporter receptor subunit TctC
VINFYGVMTPAGTPRPIITRIHDDIVKALNLPDLKERMANDGTDTVGSTPEAFTAYLKTEVAKWAKVVKAANVRGE